MEGVVVFIASTSLAPDTEVYHSYHVWRSEGTPHITYWTFYRTYG